MITDERKGWTSASNAEADALCPGRHLAQRGLQDSKTPDSELGDVVHAALAQLDRMHHLNAFKGLTGDAFDLAHACMALEAEAFREWLGDGDEEKVEEHREKRLWDEFSNLKHSGKADVVYLSGERALILDYKTGRGEVAPNNRNLQLRDLAVLVAVNYEVKEVAVKIIQPHAPPAPACTYTLTDLSTALQDMQARVMASNNPHAKRIPGPAQCEYCKAKAVCHELLGAANIVPLEPQLPSQVHVESTIKALDNRKLGVLLSLSRMVSDVAESEVRERLSSGSTVDGWTFKPGRNTEKIVNPQGVWANASAKGVTVEQFMGCVSVTKSGLKDALRAATDANGKALDSLVAECCQGCTEAKTSAPVLTAVKQ